MRFDLSDDQQLLRTATADFLASECPMDVSRQIAETPGEGFSRAHWRKLAELGYLGLVVGERHGGQGLGPIEVAVVCEELGKACFPGPFLDVVLAAKVLEASGVATEPLEAIVAGKSVVVIASRATVWPGEKSNVAVRGDRVTGSMFFVPHGASADHVVVVVGEEVLLADGPFMTTAMPTLDEAQRFVEAKLDNPVRRLGTKQLIDSVEDLGAVGAGAFALGLGEAALSRSVDYSRQRETFGKPIGAYQVLQHRMADMLLRIESSRAAVYRAAWSLACDAPDARLIVAAAKAYAVESACAITRDSVQIHGGNGFTWEYDLHCFLKRAATLDQHHGSTAAMAERALVALEATL